MVAGGVTSWDGKSEDITDPTIGVIKFYIKEWAPGTTFDTLFREVETKVCPPEVYERIVVDQVEDDSGSGFYRAAEHALSDIQIYGPKLRCLSNQQELKLWGNFDTAWSRNLMVVFEMCNNSTSSVTCKSESEIREWFNFKYIVTIVNQRKFIHHKFAQERIQKISELQWHALNYNTRADYTYRILRTDHELNDHYFNIGGFLTESEHGYHITSLPTR